MDTKRLTPDLSVLEFSYQESDKVFSDHEIREIIDLAGDFRRIKDIGEISIAKDCKIDQQKIKFLNQALQTIDRFFRMRDELPLIKQPDDVVKSFYFLSLKSYEELWVGFVDGQGRLTGKRKVKKGENGVVRISLKEIFGLIFKYDAWRVILVHNHPSGNSAASSEDIKFTKKFSKAAKLLDIEFLDHLIVTDDSYYSFREHLLI